MVKLVKGEKGYLFRRAEHIKNALKKKITKKEEKYLSDELIYCINRGGF